MKNPLEGFITISRPTGGAGSEVISIRVEDKDAGLQFLRVEIKLSDFTQCLTGRSHTPCCFQVVALENVGRIVEHMQLVFPLPASCPGSGVERRAVAAQIAAEQAPDGWKSDGHFGSQRSFFTDGDGDRMARANLVRYLDRDPGRSDN